MKTPKNAVRYLVPVAFALSAGAASAIDGQVRPADKQDFICKVAPNIGVADSFWSQQKSMSRIRGGDGCPQSWWQQASFSGDKYKVLACDAIRVVAANVAAAGQDVYDMYLKNAPEQPAQRVGVRGVEARRLTKVELVQNCEPDPTSTRGVAVHQVDPSTARLVITDTDHLATALSLNPQNLDDEAMAKLFNTRFSPSADAFDRHEAIVKAAAEARAAVKRVPPGAFRIETSINVSPYSFEKNKFELPRLATDIQEVTYSHNVMAGAPQAEMPAYALALPESLKAGYAPANMDEAKRIERARAAASYNMKAVVYVQPTKGWMSGGRPVLNGLVSRVDVTDGKGATLFSLIAK